MLIIDFLFLVVGCLFESIRNTRKYFLLAASSRPEKSCYRRSQCRSPTLADQVLVDIPHTESVMFGTEFTYLKTVDVTCYF